MKGLRILPQLFDDDLYSWIHWKDAKWEKLVGRISKFLIVIATVIPQKRK